MNEGTVRQRFDRLRVDLENEFGDRVRIQRFPVDGFVGLRLEPLSHGGLSLDVYAEGDWLRVIGGTGSRLDTEFDGADEEAQWALARALVWNVGRFGADLVWERFHREFRARNSSTDAGRVGVRRLIRSWSAR